MKQLIKNEIINSLKEDEFGFILKIYDNEFKTFKNEDDAEDYLDGMRLTERELSDFYFLNTGRFIEDLKDED